MEYQVTWTIDIDADSHEDAARKALEIQRDPDSIALVFETVLKNRAKSRWVRKEIDLGKDTAKS